MMMHKYIAFFSSACFLVLGQYFWKVAATQIKFDTNLIDFIFKIMLNPQFILGAFLYVFATLLWVYLLGQFQFSKIYPPFVGTTVILSLVFGYLFLNEYQNIGGKLLGSAIILLGIYIIV